MHPLLLAAYAVLFLYASNLSEADFGQVLPVLILVLGIVGALLVAGSLVLRDALRAAVLLSAFVALFFGYRHVAILTDGLPIEGRPVQRCGSRSDSGRFCWRGAVVAAARGHAGAQCDWACPRDRRARHDRSPRAWPGRRGARTRLPCHPPVALEGRAPRHLVPGLRPLRLRRVPRLNYGIEEELTPWLAARGFHVTPDAHANYARTRLSLASILNLDYLDALRGRPVAELLQDHAVGRFLTDLGYRYIHIGSRYQPTRTSPLANVNRSLYEHE